MNDAASAGWYADPTNPTLERWWDGTSWSDATRERISASTPHHAGDVPQAAPGHESQASPRVPSSPVPAGWYPDPSDASTRRWWDGYQWTATIDPAGSGPLLGQNSAPRVGSASTLEILAGLAIALTFLASFLPWGRVAFITVNGTDGDGVITAALSLAAGIVFFIDCRRSRSSTPLLVTSIVAMTLAAATFIYDGTNLARSAGSDGADAMGFDLEVTIGVGIYLGIVASVGSIVLLVLTMKARRTAS